jgi:hypothetical protein
MRFLSLIFLFLSSLLTVAQSGDPFASFNEKIDSLTRLQDTSGVSQVFSRGIKWAEKEKLSKTDGYYLEFRIEETRHLMRYSKIAVDTAISRYRAIYELAATRENYLVQARALGFMANAYRSKRELGKAFEANQKEIEAAALSGDRLLLGRALITELDIAYNSLPSPMQPEELEELVVKGEYVIHFSEENKLTSVLPFGKLYLSKFFMKQGEFERAKSILFSISDEESISVTFSKYEELCEITKQTKDLVNYRSYTLEFKSRAYQTKRAFVALNVHNYLLDYSLQVKDSDSAAYYAKLLERNLKEVDTTKYLDFLDVSYSTLSRYYKGKNPNKELQYLSYSMQINKIISTRQKEAFSAILKYNNELAQLEKTNSILVEANSFFKTNLFAVLGLLLLLGIVVIVILRKFKGSRKRAAKVLLEKQHMEETVTKKYIELNNKQRIYLDDLKYLKADRNYVEFYTEAKRTVDRGVLTSVLGELPPNFIQVHRSYVINKNFIKATSGGHVILFPDIEIPLSRSFKNKLVNSL